VLVEDDPLVASLLGESLEHANFTIEIAHSAAEAIKRASKFDPDVAVIDINLGQGASGVELAYVLDQRYPGISLMLLTKHPDLRTAGYSEDEIPAGCGFLRKDLIHDSDALVAAIEQVIASRAKPRQDSDPLRPFKGLTNSQVDMLRMISQGYTNNAIARQRKVSVRAVEISIRGIYQNLGIPVDGEINPRVEAARVFITSAGTPDRK
jgi:DNA-binding NarL/FixJ family response regulator